MISDPSAHDGDVRDCDVVAEQLSGDATFPNNKRLPAPGQDWDMMYGRAAERPRADRNIEQTPLPQADPIFGTEGPLMERWD